MCQLSALFPVLLQRPFLKWRTRRVLTAKSSNWTALSGRAGALRASGREIRAPRAARPMRAAMGASPTVANAALQHLHTSAAKLLVSLRPVLIGLDILAEISTASIAGDPAHKTVRPSKTCRRMRSFKRTAENCIGTGFLNTKCPSMAASGSRWTKAVRAAACARKTSMRSR